MDLLSLMQALWRYKVTSLVVLSLTGLAVAGVLVWTPPVYTASASLLLVEPPDPPAESKSLIPPENPFVRYADNSVIINVVARRVQQADVRSEIAVDGGVETYEVAISRRFGGSSPIIDILVTADSRGDALATVNLVAERTTLICTKCKRRRTCRPSTCSRLGRSNSRRQAVRVVSGTLRKA